MPRFALVAVLLVLALFAAGCNKGNKAAQSSAPETANLSAVDLYNAKNYPDALARAEQDALTTKGRDKEVAQLTAGLSAYALNRPALAQTYLESLTGSSDIQIAGRAEAVLGQIADKRGNRGYAADLYKRASTKLEGDDSARASVRAGRSLTAVNKPAEAATQFRAAAREADSISIKRTATKLGQPGPFTIQLAAFSSRTSAEKKVVQMRPATIKAGMGSPRIVPDTINGKPGYAVQVGMFTDRSAAEAAKPKLGMGQYMIVSAN